MKFDEKNRNNSFSLFQGSTVDRSASDKEKSNPCPTLKDNDFLEKKRTIDLGAEQKRIFIERLKRDVNVRESNRFQSLKIFFRLQFLVSQHKMDYSLLIGIHDLDLGGSGP